MAAVYGPGEVLRAGRYEIERLLREAPDKQVYVAVDTKTDSRVAVDVFSNNVAMPSGLSVSAWEAHVLGNLGDHPNIGQFIEHWEEDGAAVMVSRYWGGGRLSERIQRCRDAGEHLAVEQIIDFATQIARGLAHIHERRILYRDLEPQNVLFDMRGNIHLVDFDIAVSLDDAAQSDLSRRPDREYIAPEAMHGARLDERADLFSLGATVYEMCCGQPPGRDKASGDPPSIDRDDIPDGLRDLIRSLLAIDPAERPESAAEVARRLHELREARTDLERLLRSDESMTLEFKASLRTPIGPPRANDTRGKKELEKVIEHEALETIAAFLNSEGGTLILGVEDDGTVIGIEVDFPRVNGTRDGWRRTFDDLVSSQLGTDAMSLIELRLEPWQRRTVAVVDCRRRDEPTWMHDHLFVRRTASTEQLDPKRTVAWYVEHWGLRRP